jgi:hypothetical protein
MIAGTGHPRIGLRNIRLSRMLSCSKMEHDDMASKDHPQQPSERREPKDSRPEKERLPQGGPPPLLNDGLELVRDSHC